MHRKSARPLTIFTSLYFSHPSQPEMAHQGNGPFKKLVQAFGTFERGSPGVQVYPRFRVDEEDILLQKTRWYAGAGNTLEQILRSQKHQHGHYRMWYGVSPSKGGELIMPVTVWIEPFWRHVMSTIYRLFDLDFNIYVISDNVLELLSSIMRNYRMSF